MAKIRIGISGVGNRALPKNPSGSNWRGWVDLIRRSDDFELAAAQDISRESLGRLIERGYLDAKKTFVDFQAMLEATPLDAVLISNPAQYHADTIQRVLKSGAHCLVEKPLVDELTDVSKVLEAMKAARKMVCVIQNWRTKDVGQAMRRAIADGVLGRVGHVFFRYVRNRENPNYPAYIFQEKHPLLYAMGVHHLDLVRYVLRDEFVCARGEGFKPPWSLYASDTGVNLFLKTARGAAVVYSGTISSMNQVLPQESWVIEGEKGTLANDSQWLEPPLLFYPKGSREAVDLTPGADTSVSGQYDISDQRILDNFAGVVLRGETPLCEARDAARTMAALEACRAACETGATQQIISEDVGMTAL